MTIDESLEFGGVRSSGRGHIDVKIASDNDGTVVGEVGGET